MRILVYLSIILTIFCLNINVFADANHKFNKINNEARVFTLIKEKKWQEAINLANKNTDPILKKIILSQQFLDKDYDGNNFEKITKFLQQNPHWPQNYLLKLRAESYLSADTDKKLILNWFSKNTPSTCKGYKYRALASASLMEKSDSSNSLTQKSDKLKKIIKSGWHKGCFSVEEQKLYHKKFSSYLTEDDHIRKIDNHLWNNEITAARNSLYLVSNDYKRSFKAQIALIKNSKNAKKLFKKVLIKNYTAGLIYRYLNFCKKNLPSGSKIVSVINSIKIDQEYANKFWKVQNYLAREFIEKKKYRDAYKVINSSFTNNPGNKSESEYLSGWLALRFLNKPKLALKHFRNFNRIVKTPISKSRGIYWLARAHEAEKNTKKAMKLYKIAASEYSHTFYGQVSLTRLGEKNIQLPNSVDLNKYKKSAAEFIKNNDILKATKIVSQYGSSTLAQTYINSTINRAKSDSDILNIAYNINELGNIHHTAWVAKSAIQKNLFLKDHAYPAPYQMTDLPIEEALVYSIIRQESVFDPYAVSSAKAHGLMQVIKDTACDIAKKISKNCDVLKLTNDHNYNIAIGSNYLKQMIDQYNDSYILGIAAYNAGPHRVDKWLKIYGDPRKMKNIKNILDWIELIPYYETRNYVQRVLENLQIYRTITGKNNKFNLISDLIREGKIMNQLKIGDIAPEFSISISEDKSLNLKDLKGKYVVLYFYPKDSTPGCTIEARDFNSHLDEFKSLGAEIIGVSKDDLNSHDKFRNKHNLQFALGSDADVKVCTDYGVWGEKSMFGKKYMGISRATFLINPEGEIAYIWPKVSVIGHASDVMKKIKELQNENN